MEKVIMLAAVAMVKEKQLMAIYGNIRRSKYG